MAIDVKSEQVIDGIMLDNNSIGYINYESLMNKPHSDRTLSKSGYFADSGIVGEKFGLIFNEEELLQDSPSIRQEFIDNILKSNPIKSNNYTGPIKEEGYSTAGIFIDLINLGVIHTPGFYTTSKGKAYFRGDVSATNLTLNDNVKIPLSNIKDLHKIAQSGSYNDLSNVPNFFEIAKNYGSLETTGVIISDDGKLHANGAIINGTLSGSFNGSVNIKSGNIGGCNIDEDGKLIIPIEQIQGFNVTNLIGKKGSINLDTGTFDMGFNRFVFYNNDSAGTVFKITPYANTDNCVYMDNTNTFYNYTDNNTSAFNSSKISFSDDNVGCSLSCDGLYFSYNNNNNNVSIYRYGNNIRITDPTFVDYYEKATYSDSQQHWRRPIASVGTDGLNIGFMKSKTNTDGKAQVGVWGQWGTEDANGAYTGTTSGDKLWTPKFINLDSQSDIRLKKNIKNSSVSALPRIMKMPVREFDWKETNVHQPLGLVADEIETIDSLLTIGGGYEPDGSMNIKSIDRLLLTEYAIKAIQEQQTIIEKQQKEIDVLKKTLNIK